MTDLFLDMVEIGSLIAICLMFAGIWYDLRKLFERLDDIERRMIRRDLARRLNVAEDRLTGDDKPTWKGSNNGG